MAGAVTRCLRALCAVIASGTAGWFAAVAEAQRPPVPREDAALILACEQAQHRIILLDTTRDWNADANTAVVWSWSAASDPSLPEQAGPWFRHPSDAKRVLLAEDHRWSGLHVLTCASGGGVALIDVASGRAVFHAHVGGNPHSVAMLPDGNIACVSSTGNRLTALIIDKAGGAGATLESALIDGHGLAWDAQRDSLWALGGKVLKRYRYRPASGGDRPRLEETLAVPLPQTPESRRHPRHGGHDLAALPGEDALAVSDMNHLWQYDPDTATFAALNPGHANAGVKSIARQGAGGPTLIMQAAADQWWSDTLRFLESGRTLTLPGARFYKARWWLHDHFQDPQPQQERLTDIGAPAWFQRAVWYQIFPERFRNGDAANDPTVASLAGTWPYQQPDGWSVSPWTADWYAPQPWEQRHNNGDFYVNAQLRRYGGDLQGILEKLDYLDGLGVNALYLNPVFESPSLHKYGARCFHHIDRHFGPDPEGDARIQAAEDPADPASWQWTAADRLFLKLIDQCHRRGMRIIIDGVFNHVGIPFWALQRAKAEGPGSPYAEWFRIHSWPDPDVPGSAFDYDGWVGIKDLPVFRQDASGPVAPVKEHLQAVVRRWMDPDGDGDPRDGIDGWRLDVAAEVPLTFWKEFRTWVRAIRPDAFLTGEVWWDDYTTHTMMNAAPWLQGDAFDSVMNYRFGDAVLRFVNPTGDAISPSQFGALLQQVHREYGYATALGVQNYLGSHDTARVASAVVNPECRLDHDANLQQNRDYRVRAPNAEERQRQRLIAALHLLLPGAPALYYGDEAGLWGADDPDCRKPMLWPELTYAPETFGPFGATDRRDPVAVDTALTGYYRRLIALRRSTPALMRGTFRILLASDARRLFAFERGLDATGETIAFVCNASGQPQTFHLAELGRSGAWSATPAPITGQVTVVDGQSQCRLAPWSGALLQAAP